MRSGSACDSSPVKPLSGKVGEIALVRDKLLVAVVGVAQDADVLAASSELSVGTLALR
jgi:hypothetical protein